MHRLLSVLSIKKIFPWLLCVIGFAVYASCLSNGFVLDDKPLIVNNLLIRSWSSLLDIFQTSNFNGPYDLMYRPLQILSYSIDYHLWHLQPLGFHLTSIFLHIFNALLVYRIINVIFKQPSFSLLASILFLVHPVHVSVVAYISGRADILSACFMLLSIFCFIKFLTGKVKLFYVLSLVAAGLALLSRESSLLLVMFIILVIFTLERRLKDYLLALPFLCLGLAYILLRSFIFSGSGLAMHASLLSWPLRIINFFEVIARYLSILVLPLDMHMFRSTALIREFLSLKACLAVGFILLMTAAFIKFRKNKPLFFGLVWFFIGLAPVFLYLDGYAVLNKAVMAESWLYFSSIGFFVLAAYLCGRLKNIGKLICALLVIFYAFLTMVNNRYYRDDIMLYNNILSYDPANPLRKGLIMAYLEKGLYEEALLQVEAVRAVSGDGYDFYFYSGLYYFYNKQFERARQNFRLALSKFENCYVYYNLSICSDKLNQLPEAINYALDSYRLDPLYLPTLIHLGDLYLREEMLTEAEKYYQQALRLDPYNIMIQNRLLRLRPLLLREN